MTTITEQRTWLNTAADRLDNEGNHKLANEARAEALALVEIVPAVVTVRCDSCNRPIRSEARLNKYNDYGVDWALCAKCEHHEDRNG